MKLFDRFRTAPTIETVKGDPIGLADVLRGPRYPSSAIDRELNALSAKMRGRTQMHGSGRFSVAEHFQRASSLDRKAALLEQLVKFKRAKSILEVGTAYGASAIVMALAQDAPRLVTIEGSANQAEIGRENIAAVVPAVECVFENEASALPRLVAEGRRFDFVFHDAAHRGDFYVRAFDTLLPALEPGAMFVLDDIQWDDKPENRARTKDSPISCREGWQEIVGREAVKHAALINGRIGILLM